LTASLLLGPLNFVGNAEAILFSGNTATSSPTTIDTFLTYTSASFLNVDVPVGPASASLTNLGTFTLNVCGSVNCVEDFGPQDGIADFTLRITFTDPVVSGSPALFTADIFGTISRSGNSNNIGSGSLLTIDFVNTAQHFSYSNAFGSGTFDISVNDPAPYTLSIWQYKDSNRSDHEPGLYTHSTNASRSGTCICASARGRASRARNSTPQDC